MKKRLEDLEIYDIFLCDFAFNSEKVLTILMQVDDIHKTGITVNDIKILDNFKDELDVGYKISFENDGRENEFKFVRFLKNEKPLLERLEKEFPELSL